jgi:hypothetical protein
VNNFQNTYGTAPGGATASVALKYQSLLTTGFIFDYDSSDFKYFTSTPTTTAPTSGADYNFWALTVLNKFTGTQVLGSDAVSGSRPLYCIATKDANYVYVQVINVSYDTAGTTATSQTSDLVISGINMNAGSKYVLTATNNDFSNGVPTTTGLGGGTSFTLPAQSFPALSLTVYRFPISTVPTSGLVAHYRMEQNGNDSSTSANNATATGGTVSYTASGGEGYYSAGLDGTGVRLIAPDSTSLRITGNLSVACLVKPTAWTSQPNLIAKSFNTGYRLRITSTGKLNLILGKDALGNTVNVASTGALTANVWQHVAATVGISGTTATIKFYINGVLNSTSTATLSAIYGGTGALSLGTRDNSAAEALNGGLDQVLIYNRELTATEIADIY